MGDTDLIASATRLSAALKAKQDADNALTTATNALTLAQTTVNNATQELADAHTAVSMAMDTIAAENAITVKQDA
jgi:hypothetical protein